MIELAHDCAVLGIPFEMSRLLGEPPGEYALALSLIADRVSETNRRESEKAKAAR
jgi:hypothetical protein